MFNLTLIKRKKAVKCLIAFFIAIVCLIPLCSCSEGSSSGETSAINGSSRRKQVDIHRSIKEMLGFDIDGDFIDGAEITNDSLESDTYGKIKIQVKKGKEDELFNLLQEKFGKPQVVDPAYIPRYQEHQYAFELRQMQNIRHFSASKSGNNDKSVTINIYMANKSQVDFLYIFG